MQHILKALGLLCTIIAVQAGNTVCSCTTALLPIHVDVDVPKDPTSPLGGLDLPQADKRHLVATYNISSILCEPAVNQHPGLVQLLQHGFTANHQYWTVPTSTFSNYSYASFACENGLTTFAYDMVGAGHSSRPVNASDIQMPTLAAISSQIGSLLKNRSSSLYTIFHPSRFFTTVIGVGHSLGSITFNYGAIIDGSHSPFDALILTGWIHNRSTPAQFVEVPAREVDPLRWGDLDPEYVTTHNLTVRSRLWPSDPARFSAQFLSFDELTKDVASQYPAFQVGSASVPAKGFAKPVIEIIGTEDQVFCTKVPCDDARGLTEVEKQYFPDSQNFSVLISEGSGHDLNYGFNARSLWQDMLNAIVNFGHIGSD